MFHLSTRQRHSPTSVGGLSATELTRKPQDWLDSTQAPSFALTKCLSCASPTSLLLQLNGDLPDRFPGHERRLYVFGCRKKGCRRKEGSVRAVRATRVSAEATARAREKREREERDREEKERAEEAGRKEREGLGEKLFGVQRGAFGAPGGAGANPFSTTGGAAASGMSNPFAKPASGGMANPFSIPAAPAQAPDAIPAKSAEDAAKDLPRTFAETLSLNNTQATTTTSTKPPQPAYEPWPPESDLSAPYPVSYLAEADYETLDPLPLPTQNVSVSNMDVDDGGGGAGGSGGGGKEDKNVFESTIDSTFQKFADRLSQNPEQCIRYEFGGAPLLFSRTDAVGRLLHDDGAGEMAGALPRCAGCGGRRAFEVQLTPRAIVELEEGEGTDVLEGMDWGTVLVGVCERDCTPGGAEGEAVYVQEWVGVQWEELTARR